MPGTTSSRKEFRIDGVLGRLNYDSVFLGWSQKNLIRTSDGGATLGPLKTLDGESRTLSNKPGFRIGPSIEDGIARVRAFYGVPSGKSMSSQLTRMKTLARRTPEGRRWLPDSLTRKESPGTAHPPGSQRVGSGDGF
jgi:hypothetical protein